MKVGEEEEKMKVMLSEALFGPLWPSGGKGWMDIRNEANIKVLKTVKSIKLSVDLDRM